MISILGILNSNIRNAAGRRFIGLPLYCWLSVAVLSILKLFLVSGQHISAIGNAPHDDGLFLSLANNLVHFNWLGNYNVYTLIKGPFYPIWIALSNFAHIPLLFSEHLLYIFACIILIIALRPIVKRTWVLLTIFTIISFNPMSFIDGPATRVIREGIYPALALLVIALFTGVLLRTMSRPKKILLWSVPTGVALSCFWLTREESVWIMPFVILLVLYSLFLIWRSKDRQWKTKIVLLILPLILLGISTVAISELNYYKYGVLSTVEFKNPSFLNAYGALTRVKAPISIPYVPVSEAQRQIIYSISPAFSELKSQLEGDVGRGWAKFRFQPLDSTNDVEIQGGWFMWAFRDAVSRTSTSTAYPVYRLYDTVTGIHYFTTSESKKSSLEKTLGSKYVSEGIAFYEYPDTSVDKDSSPIYRSYDTNGDYYYSKEPHGQNNVAFYAYDRPQNGAVPIYDFVMTGSNKHFYTTSETEKDSILLHSGSLYKFEGIAFYAYAQYPPGSYYTNGRLAMSYYQRVANEINSACDQGIITCFNKRSTMMPPWNSSYYMPTLDSIYQGTLYTINFGGFRAEPSASVGDESSLRLISEITREDVNRQENISKISILNSIGKAYAFSSPTLVLLSLLIFLFQLLNIKKNYKNLKLMLSFAIAAAYFARIFGMALISATSFPVMNSIYLSSQYPLLLLFILLNFSMLYDMITTRRLKETLV